MTVLQDILSPRMLRQELKNALISEARTADKLDRSESALRTATTDLDIAVGLNETYRSELALKTRRVSALDNERQAQTEKQTKRNAILTPLRRNLETLFPEDPYVFDGEWSWAGSRIDIVFPELFLFDIKLNKWIAVGLAIHCFRENDAEDGQKLLLAANRFKVPLLLMQATSVVDTPELIRRIEKVFENKLSVPQAKIPV